MPNFDCSADVCVPVRKTITAATREEAVAQFQAKLDAMEGTVMEFRVEGPMLPFITLPLSDYQHGPRYK